MTPLKLMLCNKYNAFFAPQGLAFWNPESSQNYIFQDTFLDTLFDDFVLMKVVDLRTPSKSSGHQEGIRNRPSGANKLPKSIAPPHL